MRRVVIGLVIALVALISYVQPVSADGSAVPRLTSIGHVNAHVTSLNHCLFIPYGVENAASFDFKYFGPDGLLHTATGTGRPNNGEVGVCPDVTWPVGWYRLVEIAVYANDPTYVVQQSLYIRSGHVLLSEPQFSVSYYSGLSLSNQDFWFSG